MSADVGNLVNTFTFAELEHVLHRMFNHAAFASWNPLLTPGDRAGLRQTPVVWPAKPVFSPYACVKDQYTQICMPVGRHTGVRVHTHRIAARVFLRRDLPPGLDVSHRLHIGKYTER